MTTRSTHASGDAFAPPTIREIVLGAAAALLVVAVSDDPAVEWIGGVACIALMCAAGWVAYIADEERKRGLTNKEREQEWEDEQL